MIRKVLITGVAGFIGSKIASRLIDENFKVYGVDDLSSGKKDSIPNKVDLINLDITEKKKFNKLPNQIDFILHLSGQSSGEISFENPIEDLSKNTISTLNLINYAIKNRVKKIIYASSMSVYGNYKYKVKENLSLNPLSCYGVGKLASENYLKIFKKKIPYINLRMFNVFGPGQDLTNLKQGMVSIYLAQALKKNKIDVKGSILRVRDFIYIDDVVEVWFQSLIRKNIINQDFNVGTGNPVKISNLLNLIKKKFRGCKINILENTPGDQNFICSNNLKLKKSFKIKKFIQISEGLDLYINKLKYEK